MNVLYINDTDLFARNYNGYNLLEKMLENEYQAKMMVKRKSGHNNDVIKVGSDKCIFAQSSLTNYNNLRSFESNLYSGTYLKEIMQSDAYKKADIIHIHITYLYFLSFYDYDKIFKNKAIVITLHDTWFLTGGCTNSFECENYKSGCKFCEVKTMEHDRNDFIATETAFKYKLELFKNHNINVIYASDLLGDYFKNSEFSKYANNHVKIPFGVEIKKEDGLTKEEAKAYFEIKDKFVVGFRNDSTIYKGRKYVHEALAKLDEKDVVILTITKSDIPAELQDKYKFIHLGYVKDNELMNKFYNACDVFLMPSTSETFGLMAIEAMANGTPVLCFKDTVLEDITFANENCGIAVEKLNSNEIADKLKYFINNRIELEERGKLSYKLAKEHYSIEKYFNSHLEFYNKILNS